MSRTTAQWRRNLYRIVHEEFPCQGCYAAGDPIHRPVEGFTGWDVDYVGTPAHQTGETILDSRVGRPGGQLDRSAGACARCRDHGARGPCLFRRRRTWSAWTESASLNSSPPEEIYGRESMRFEAIIISHFRGRRWTYFALPKFDYYMFQSQRPPENKTTRAGLRPNGVHRQLWNISIAFIR